jgi:6-phosphogluconolactonase
MITQLHLCQDAEALAQHARDWLVQLVLKHCAASQVPFSIALSGGSTPKHLYQLLAELPNGRLDWTRVLLLWGDERNVPIDDAASNFRMVSESLLDRIQIPQANVLGVPSPGGSPQAAAEDYERLLRTRLPLGEQAVPAIDCVLLGLGDDVHTASLFPGTAAVTEASRLVVANAVPQLDCWRMTMTAPLINAARSVAFLISGASKQQALAKLWHADLDPMQYPAQLIQPAGGQLCYFVDQAALGDTPPPATVAIPTCS